MNAGRAESISRKGSAIATRLDDELVLLSLERDSYFSTGPVGARIWELIATPCTVPELVAMLMKAFEVDEAQCRQDVEDFLTRLVAADLAEWHRG